MTYTYVILSVSRQVFKEVREKLKAAGYEDQLYEEEAVIDMHGIALQEEQ